jgi:hypothetical protein
MDNAVLLTVDQIRIYKKYKGDDDGFSRVATSQEKTIMKDVNWARVSELIQLLFGLQHGNTTSAFAQQIMRDVSDSCADQAAVNELSELAR